MKIKCLILAILLLVPIGLKAEDSSKYAINIGSYYGTDVGTFGVSINGMRKLQNGLFELSAVGSMGPGENSLGITSGLFIMEGGLLEIAILQGASAKYPVIDGPAYVAGTSGLLMTYQLPWLGRVFGQWQREYPLDKENALEPTHKLTLGISFDIN